MSPCLRVQNLAIQSVIMETLGVGIIGFGRIGAEHERWMRGAKGVAAVGAADSTAARREIACARGLEVYESIDGLLNDSRVEAVLVSTPTALHYRQAMTALRAGKHVMVEKPMALDLAQACEMVRQADRQGKVLSVFHNRRWDVDYLTVQKHMREGVFGRVFNIESRLGQWASCAGPAAREFRPGWRNESAYGGGGLYDWGSHFVDQLWRLMRPGRPVRVYAQLRGNVWSNDCDDLARVCVDFEDGATGLVEINTTTRYPPPRWHIDGMLGSGQSPFSENYDTRRWAELDFAPAERGKEGIPGAADGKVAEGEQGAGVVERAAIRLPTARPGLTERQIWERFAAATRGEGEPAVTSSSVLPTMQLLDAARESSRRGVAVVINSAAWPV